MKIKRLVLLSLGVLGASMPFGVYAVNPIMPMAQQEQLQEDREAQQERNLRLDTERVETVVSEPAPIDVPSDQNGTSFLALCQMLGCSPYEPSLAPIICMVGAILFAQK